MKLMKINNLETAFILIWFTIASVNCQQCISKSFNITTTIVSVDRTDISIAYNIYLMVSTDNTTEYAKNCLKSIIFKYKKIDSSIYSIYEQDFNNLTSFVQFKNLQYLTEYSFDISYKQNIDNSQTEIVDVYKDARITTCFGEPDQPQNLRNQTNLDGSILFSWDKPIEINAPSVCYYLIVINDLKTENVSKIETLNMNYLVSANDRKNNLRIDLSAINEAKCYSQQYPFVNNCKYSKTGSKPFYISISAYVPSTTTPPNTTKNPYNVSLSKYSVNNVLLIFLTMLLIIYNL
jgi:hypothetical protein